MSSDSIRRPIIALDFDGTVCKHGKYPAIGEPVPGALPFIRRIQATGTRMFLWTCREGHALVNAIEYLDSNAITLNGYNAFPYDFNIATSNKLFANIYIDDAALCAPLTRDADSRPYLDWSVAGPVVLQSIDDYVRWQERRK